MCNNRVQVNVKVSFTKILLLLYKTLLLPYLLYCIIIWNNSSQSKLKQAIILLERHCGSLQKHHLAHSPIFKTNFHVHTALVML